CLTGSPWPSGFIPIPKHSRLNTTLEVGRDSDPSRGGGLLSSYGGCPVRPTIRSLGPMSLIPKRMAGSSRGSRVDREGELYNPPRILSYVWALLVLLLLIE